MARTANRDSDTREKNQRKKSWTPPNLLPEPTPQEGYRFRWIRTSILGDSDPTNVSVRRREGWEPVKAEDHPELMTHTGNASGNVEIGGLVLCKASEEFVESRNEYYSDAADRTMESVDNNLMKESNPRMPILKERQSRTTFGNG